VAKLAVSVDKVDPQEDCVIVYGTDAIRGPIEIKFPTAEFWRMITSVALVMEDGKILPLSMG
jgi:hypothetical protein